MHRPFFLNSRRSLVLTVLATCHHAALASDTDHAPPLTSVIVKGGKAAVPANLPATTESVTAKQIAETINAVTSGAALNYLPSTHVRERYIGDRNGILVMRVNGSTSSAQTTVYADNLLLSNFLNNSFSTPPRWGMVGPEEIERIDVIYGPFSALYPGNSAGGVVLMTTRMPQQFEAHAKVDLFGQRFKLYGTDQAYNGAHGSAAIGTRSGDWSLRLGVDHLDNHGQPQTFGAATRASVTGTPAFTFVRGERRDLDTGGNARIITSAIGADHTVQDIAKIKLAYDFSPTMRATYTLGLWQNKSDTGVANYLEDGASNPVYNTSASASGPARYVKFAGDPNYYTLAGTAPGHSESEHVMHGLALKSSAISTVSGTWGWEAVASLYAQNREISRTANTSLNDSGTGVVRPSGVITVGDGTGWVNLDLRGDWRPLGNSGHRLSFGYHVDRYTLQSVTSSIAGDWLYGSAAAPSSNSYGKTSTSALYLQHAWQFQPDWTLVAGGRLERWRAYDGSNFNGANAARFRQLDYASRSSTDFSPKLSLSYQATPQWALRGAFGAAVRYPTVAEIFQVISLPNNVKQNDPNLKPEKVGSGELAIERALEGGLLRTSLFWERKRDALIAQSDTTVIPNISSIQNVDRVHTRGVESAFELHDLWLRGLDVNGSATYARSTITKDSRNPGLAGTDQPRIPNWRATLVATLHASDRLSYSLSYRYSGRQHNALYNTSAQRYNDVNPNVYGAISSYSVFDAKVLYKLTRQWAGSLGINNLGNDKYYVNPNPYPQRTLFASLRYDY
jgi:iron complex outermembrane receptor protein